MESTNDDNNNNNKKKKTQTKNRFVTDVPLFRYIFVYFEVLSVLLSGAYAIAAPESIARTLFNAPPSIRSDPTISSLPARIMTQSWGVVLILVGLIQFKVLSSTRDASIVRWVLSALLVCDLIHVAVWCPVYYYNNNNNNNDGNMLLFSFPSLANNGTTLLLALARCYFLAKMRTTTMSSTSSSSSSSSNKNNNHKNKQQ